MVVMLLLWTDKKENGYIGQEMGEHLLCTARFSGSLRCSYLEKPFTSKLIPL
jgi:hypothetical protein